MDDFERIARMAMGSIEELERIPGGIEFDWLQPQTNRGQTYAYQAYFSDDWPKDFIKEEIRQCKINLLMRILDDANHGYSWLFRFDEKWEPIRNWEKVYLVSERHRKMTLRAELTRYSDYENIPLYRRQAVIWKPLRDYGARELADELRRRIGPEIKKRLKNFVRPIKFFVQRHYWRAKIFAVDNRRKIAVRIKSGWENFWNIKW